MTPTPDLTLAQLRCFLAVVDARSFAEAARRLGLSISAVSRLIGRFEAAHGIKLLHRSTHALSPTEDGQRLIGPAREAVRGLIEMEGALGRLASGGDTGWVRITAPVAFLRHCLVPLLGIFAHEHPDIRLDLRASNDLVDLAHNGIDLAIRSGPLETIPGHLQQPWFVFPWVLCAAPSYLAPREAIRRPEDLSKQSVMGFRTTHNGMIRPWHLCDPDSGEPRRFVPDPWFVFDDGEAGWRAALDGLGIVSAPMFLAAGALATGAMIEVLPSWRAAAMPVSIVRRDTRLSPPRVDAVIAFLKRHPPLSKTGQR
jgi:DNA-binding transcriptional LysR family regulator